MAQLRSALIVGAGIAGLACAIELARAGVGVTVLDKGRRPGGRVATRRIDGVAFNHGAQFVTARGDAFATLLAGLQQEGIAAPWPAADAGGRRIVFSPGMAALPAALAGRAIGHGARLLSERHASFLHREAGFWVARHQDAAGTPPGAVIATGGERTPPHDAVLLAMPAVQAQALLAAIGHRFAETASGAVMAPCWAVMARFPAPLPLADILSDASPALAWAARESARPGREGGEEAWTLHATAEWSRAHLEAEPAQAGAMLLDAFRDLTGAPAPASLRAHRWRYALVERAAGAPCLWDADARIGACGDWCLGGRVEAAFDSGLALARAALAA